MKSDSMHYATADYAKLPRPRYMDGTPSPRTHYILLREGDTIDNPASTSGRRLYGPGTAILTVWPDGGLDMEFVPEWVTEDGPVDMDSPLYYSLTAR